MNFAREKCDARALQSLMHDGAFALQACNESFGTAIAVAASDVGADLNSTVAPDWIQNTSAADVPSGLDRPSKSEGLQRRPQEMKGGHAIGGRVAIDDVRSIRRCQRQGELGSCNSGAPRLHSVGLVVGQPEGRYPSVPTMPRRVPPNVEL